MQGQSRGAHRRGVHVAGPGARAVLQEVRQHVRVVLQDLPVDQVAHLRPVTAQGVEVKFSIAGPCCSLARQA